MTEDATENRQVVRSKKMLRDALIALLKQKPYDKITITELTEQADLARSTFYAHFETKDELLNFFIDDILEQFFETVGDWTYIRQNPEYGNEIGANFVQVWLENEDTLQVLNKLDIDCLLIDRFKVLHRQLFEQAAREGYLQTNPTLINFLISSNAYALVGIFRQWLNDDMRHSPEVMGQFVAHHIGPERTEETIKRFEHLIR